MSRTFSLLFLAGLIAVTATLVQMVTSQSGFQTQHATHVSRAYGSTTHHPLPVGGSVTLAWTPSTATNIVSQTLQYGVVSGNYTNSVLLPATTAQFRVTNLVYGATYYFVVKCIDSRGLSSMNSNEIKFTVPWPLPTLTTR